MELKKELHWKLVFILCLYCLSLLIALKSWVVCGFIGSSCRPVSLLERALGDLDFCSHRYLGSWEDAEVAV